MPEAGLASQPPAIAGITWTVALGPTGVARVAGSPFIEPMVVGRVRVSDGR
jgi:hypothetical protein